MKMFGGKPKNNNNCFENSPNEEIIYGDLVSSNGKAFIVLEITEHCENVEKNNLVCIAMEVESDSVIIYDRDDGFWYRHNPFYIAK